MRTQTLQRVLFVVTIAAACWDSWRWYAARIWSTPEEATTLAAAVLLVAALAVLRHSRSTALRLPLLTGAALLGLYALGYWVAPAIIRCAIATAALLWCGYVTATNERPPAAIWGLAALSMPVLPSLQFAFGYPMRVASAVLTIGLLRLQGLTVERQGTLLAFNGQTVQFDAPCSGIAMLWAGLLATLMAGAVYRLGLVRLMIALAASTAAIVVCNALRAASLFYLELGIFVGPSWWHEAVGLASFAFALAFSLWATGQLALQAKSPTGQSHA